MHLSGKKIYLTVIVAVLCLALLAGVHALSATADFSQSYLSGIFYRRLRNVDLTGDPRTDLVNVAMSQVGYVEGDSSNQLSGCTPGTKNYTEYARWYDRNYVPDDNFENLAWCAMFVSWCGQQADISSDVLMHHSYTVTMQSWYEKKGLSYPRANVAAGAYTPQPGDLVFYRSSHNTNNVNHVGIVVRYEDGILYAVEGNTNASPQSTNGGQVCLKSYSIDDTYIRYICSPKY